MKEPVPLIAVIGPTAAGKTDVGIELAEAVRGEIISVDSMQVYRKMDIGTAKPNPALLKRIPHHLIDILNPDEIYNAGMFCNDADAVIRKLVDDNAAPILVGGTALYFRALINGIIPVPEISETVRNDVRNSAKHHGVESVYQKLLELDPISAQSLHPNDITRLSRALEVYLETGMSIREFQDRHQFSEQRYDALFIGTAWSREELYRRINRRVEIMVEEGLVEETRNLLETGYSPDLPSLNAIGYRQAVQYLEGKLSLDEMIRDIQQKSRRYAKKQLTWYRKDDTIRWIDGKRLDSETVEKAARHIARLRND